MHRFLSMQTSIGYLPVRLKRRPGSTQNEVKTSPALVTTQISISAPFFLHVDTHFTYKIPSNTEFWKPLNEDNDSDIILALQNKLCSSFVTLL